MLISKPYDRERAVEYARLWATSRNPLFYDFTGGGGNCTNFVSQCLLAGGLTMDFTETFGWYYVDVNNRAPAWTGVREFYEFMCGLGDFSPQGARKGPFGNVVDRDAVEIGDVIQLGNAQGSFYHSLIVSGFRGDDILICAQSNDALDRPLSTYNYAMVRFLHVEGINIEIFDTPRYFNDLLMGESLPPKNQVYLPIPTEQ